VKPLNPKTGRRHPATLPLSPAAADYRDSGLVLPPEADSGLRVPPRDALEQRARKPLSRHSVVGFPGQTQQIFHPPYSLSGQWRDAVMRFPPPFERGRPLACRGAETPGASDVARRPWRQIAGNFLFQTVIGGASIGREPLRTRAPSLVPQRDPVICPDAFWQRALNFNQSHSQDAAHVGGNERLKVQARSVLIP